MKKRLIAMVLVMVMAVVSVTACGKSKDKSSSKDKEEETLPEEKDTFEFTIWIGDEDLSDENGSWIKTRCDMFAAKHEKDEVIFNFESYTEEDAAKKMEEDRTLAPDIFIFKSSQTDELVEDRLLTRLWGDTEEYVISSNATSIGNMAMYQDKVYGIPVSADPYVLYYDKRVLTEEDVKDLDTILEKGVLSYPLEDEKYLEAFYEAKDVVEVPEEVQKALDGINGEEIEETEEEMEPEESVEPQLAEPEEEKTEVPLEKSRVDAWLSQFKSNANVVNDADGTKGIEGLKDGSIQAAVYDDTVYEQMKENLGENLGVAALPVFHIDGMDKQMKCVMETQNVGVNPDCENFEMTIALATYLGSADSQQMHYDMSGVIPVNLTAVQSLQDLDLASVIARIADKENPGWNLPEEEEEED